MGEGFWGAGSVGEGWWCMEDGCMVLGVEGGCGGSCCWSW